MYVHMNCGTWYVVHVVCSMCTRVLRVHHVCGRDPYSCLSCFQNYARVGILVVVRQRNVNVING